MAKQSLSYHTIVKLLHWLTLVALVATSVLGFYFSDMARGPEKNELLRLHASIGLVILALVLARLAAKGFTRAPAPLNPSAVLQNRAASTVHWLLYAGMLLLIGAGMFTLFTVGWNVPFFGIFEILTWYERDMDLHHLFEDMHVASWWILTSLIALHALAVFWHQFVQRDATLSRMWFSRKGQDAKE